MRTTVRRALCAVLDVMLNPMIALPVGTLIGVVLGVGLLTLLPWVRSIWVVVAAMLGGGTACCVAAGLIAHKWAASWRLTLAAPLPPKTPRTPSNSAFRGWLRNVKALASSNPILAAGLGAGVGFVSATLVVGVVPMSAATGLIVEGCATLLGALLGLEICCSTFTSWLRRGRPVAPDQNRVSKAPLPEWMVALDRQVDTHIARSARDLARFVSWPRRLLALLIRLLLAIERIAYETYGKPYDDSVRRSDQAKKHDGQS